MHKDTLIAAVYAQREATLRRVATLPDADWDLPCPVPPMPFDVVHLDPRPRRVRDLVAHLIVVDELVLRGGAVRSWMNLRRLGSSGTWDPRRIEPLSERSVTELVTLLARRGERFAQLAAAAPAAVGHLPLRGPFGRQPLVHVVARRVVHEWLHERDLAAAQGVTPRDPHPAVGEVIADAVLSGLPSAALPQLRLDRGVVRLRISVAPGSNGSRDEHEADVGRTAPVATGGAGVAGAPRELVWSADFGRRQYGPRVAAAPDATVTLTAAALGLLATHRATPDDPQLGLTVEGEQDLAHALLAAVTMPPVHDEAPHQAEARVAS